MGFLIAAWSIGVGAWWIHISRQHVASERWYQQSRGLTLSPKAVRRIYLIYLPMAVFHGFIFCFVPIVWILSKFLAHFEPANIEG